MGKEFDIKKAVKSFSNGKHGIVLKRELVFHNQIGYIEWGETDNGYVIMDRIAFDRMKGLR